MENHEVTKDRGYQLRVETIQIDNLPIETIQMDKTPELLNKTDLFLLTYTKNSKYIEKVNFLPIHR